MAPPRAGADLMQHLERTLREGLMSSEWADKSRPNDAIERLMQPLWRAGLNEDEANAWLVALSRIVRR